MRQKYTNIRPFDTTQSILKSSSPLTVFYDQFLPSYYPARFATEREDKLLKLRPRELLGLVLMSIVGTYLDPDHTVWTPATDPLNHDGAIVRADEAKHKEFSKSGLIIEQAFIPKIDKRDHTEAIIESVKNKSSRGIIYTRSTNLNVLSERDENVDIKKVHEYVQSSIYESCYMFIMLDPKPFHFYAAVLKAPADPHQIYSILFKENRSVTITPTGEFIPVLIEK